MTFFWRNVTSQDDRLHAIKEEYSQQRSNEEKLRNIQRQIDTLDGLDPHQTEFTDKLREVYELLYTQSTAIQDHLSSINSARYRADHPNLPLRVKLKSLPVDISGTAIEPSFYLVNDQNVPLSDKLQLIRLPVASDQFVIANDKRELTIVDQNKIPISDPITFKQFPSISIKFDYAENDQRSVRIIENSSPDPIGLTVKPVSSNQFSGGNSQRHRYRESKSFQVKHYLSLTTTIVHYPSAFISLILPLPH